MRKKNSLHRTVPELWGGFECTLNRVGNSYRDQLKETGYYARAENIDLLHNLGIKACRYPILWEKFDGIPSIDSRWERATRELTELRNHNILPIVGLLHHGSGPLHTRLDDPAFPALFEEHAKKVALNFPWISHYTPINEPLTTARFSGLYGFWYPHLKDSLAFARMLLNQMKATVLAMRTIRNINPGARLVQTEDLSKVHCTQTLQYQADFENIRRWLTFDLLCAKVDSRHELYHYLLNIGIPQIELEFFLENPCPPDVIGLNYYVTSERFLDDQCQHYPHLTAGTNGRHHYIDTEAFRVGVADGVQKLMMEAWHRYTTPLAITEVHLGCTREEQLRWLNEVWSAACAASDEGVQIKGVTAWSIFGSVDWNSLVTRRTGIYESGAFDVRGGVRKTALGEMISALSNKGCYHHPLLHNKGWWRNHETLVSAHPRQPLLLIGKYGSLAQAFSLICEQRGVWTIALSRSDIDISKVDDIRKAIGRLKPWGIVNACGLSSIDHAEVNPTECFSLNSMSAANLATVCADTAIPFMTFSSDQVFDGKKDSPYTELDKVSPINCFGASKALAEALVLSYFPDALIIRTSAPFSPWDDANFAHSVMSALQNDRVLEVANDTTVSPTYVPHLINAALDLFIDRAKGVWHLFNPNSPLTWCEFAVNLARRGGYQAQSIVGMESHQTEWRARRPSNSALVSTKGVLLPSLDEAIGDYLHEIKMK